MVAAAMSLWVKPNAAISSVRWAPSMSFTIVGAICSSGEKCVSTEIGCGAVCGAAQPTRNASTIGNNNGRDVWNVQLARGITARESTGARIRRRDGRGYTGGVAEFCGGRGKVLVAAGPLLVAQFALATPSFNAGITTGTIQNAAITEASGIAASRVNDNVLWTQEDS